MIGVGLHTVAAQAGATGTMSSVDPRLAGSPVVVALLVVAAVLVTPARPDPGPDPTRRGTGRGKERPRSGSATLMSKLVSKLVSRCRSRLASPRTVRRGQQGRRAAEIPADVVVSTMVLLALGYRSGLPTWQVLGAVAARSTEDVAQDLRQVGAALQWGASDAEAWASVASCWTPAARAVRIAQHAGVPPAPLLLRAADELRHSDLERLEIAAATVGVRLVAPLGLVLLPAFCLTTVIPLVVSLGREVLATG